MKLTAKLIAFYKSSKNEADKIVTAQEKKEQDKVTALNDAVKNGTSANDLVTALAALAKNEKKADEQKTAENKIREAFGIPTVY